MTLPPHIAAALASGPFHFPGKPERCEGARFHSPTPLFVQETALVNPEWGKRAVPSPTALLCGTCRDNLLVLQALLGAHQGALAWEVRREFGNDIRRLAAQGWEAFTTAQAS